MDAIGDSLHVDNEIRLQPAHSIDSEKFLHVVKDNIESLGEWMGWAVADYSMAEVEAFIEQSRADWASGSARGYAIEFRGTLCGTIGLGRLRSPARDFEIGYWLDLHVRGNGIVTRACRALLRLSFEDLNASLVSIQAAVDNLKSRAVAERLGMIGEATLRQRSTNARGELLDLVVYSMTPEEWRARVTDG